MDVWHLRRLVINLLVIFCFVMELSGCDGTSGGSVPFSAMTSADGTASAARFNSLANVTSDGTNLYVADVKNHTIRKVVIASGVVTTLAGSNGNSGTTNGTGSEARFKTPYGITTDGINLYVTDSGNNTIRKVVIATGDVTTLAGSAGASGSADLNGSAAKFNLPTGITSDGTNLYVADTNNNTIRKVVIATGAVTTLGVSSGGSSGSSFLFSTFTSASRSGFRAKFRLPFGITTDGTNLYVTNAGNNSLFKVGIASGELTPLAVSTSGSSISSLFSAMTSANGAGSAAQFKQPGGVAFDGTNLYVADKGNNTIRKLVMATNEVTTLAGTAGTSGSTDGIGSTALFKAPTGILIDGANLYVADTGSNTIRKIVMSTGEVTTLAGKAP